MLNNIKIVGVDLDNTLYPDTPEIHNKIRGLIYKKISSEFNIPLNQATELFKEHYKTTMSGSQTIKEIAKKTGVTNYPDIIQMSLEEADIINLIEENPKLNEMLSRIKKIKELDLLTGSPYSLTFRKLDKLGVDSSVFGIILANNNDFSKTTGSLYNQWIKLRKKTPSQFLYVGDNPKQDIDVPKKLGIKTCLVGNKKYDNADFQIKNILELEKILN